MLGSWTAYSTTRCDVPEATPVVVSIVHCQRDDSLHSAHARSARRRDGLLHLHLPAASASVGGGGLDGRVPPSRVLASVHGHLPLHHLSPPTPPLFLPPLLHPPLPPHALLHLPLHPLRPHHLLPHPLSPPPTLPPLQRLLPRHPPPPARLPHLHHRPRHRPIDPPNARLSSKPPLPCTWRSRRGGWGERGGWGLGGGEGVGGR